MPIITADTHNLGRKVYFSDGKVIKPRPVGLEWIFLSSASPLRKIFLELSLFNEMCLPDLNFDNNHLGPSLKENKVDFLKLKHNDFSLSESRLEAVGAVLAIIQNFGLGDLHFENMALGESEDGNFIFSPIDIECAFESYTLASQSLVLPSKIFGAEKCGSAKLINKIKVDKLSFAPAIILRAYIETLLILQENSRKIITTLQEIIKDDSCISRVVLRETKKYINSLELGIVDSDYNSDELIQLKNGDVPYFFRFINSRKLYFWKDGKNYCESSIDVKSFDKLEAQLGIFSGDYFSMEQGRDFFKYGIAQVGKSFDCCLENNYNSLYKDVEIQYSKDTVNIKCRLGNYMCKR